MHMQRYNKTTATAVAGAIVVLVGAFFELSVEQSGALQTVITATIVWFVPNKEG